MGPGVFHTPQRHTGDYVCLIADSRAHNISKLQVRCYDRVLAPRLTDLSTKYVNSWTVAFVAMKLKANGGNEDLHRPFNGYASHCVGVGAFRKPKGYSLASMSNSTVSALCVARQQDGSLAADVVKYCLRIARGTIRGCSFGVKWGAFVGTLSGRAVGAAA